MLRIGIGFGLNRGGVLPPPLWQVVSNEFEQRVLDDGGTFEAKDCLIKLLIDEFI